MITIKENVSLKLHSTMRLGGTARYVCDIDSEEDLLEALSFANTHHIPVRAIGEGSNVFWLDEGYSGLLLCMKIQGFEVLDDGESASIGAGMEWDQAVEKSVSVGLSGLECLSLIPGTVGATPIQNVGAYGVEVHEILSSLRAYDTHEKKFVVLTNEECQFGYRTSRFKTVDSGRYIITNVTFRLQKTPPKPPFYESLQAYLDAQEIVDYTALTIRNAVVAIRSGKMPDPKKVANNGSFFANPVIEKPQFSELQERFPDIKGWEISDGRIKLAAGWLIEKAGFSDFHDQETGMATWHLQNLVLVNEHATSVHQLIAFRDKIIGAVHDMFGVTLVQEPELLP